MLPPGGLESHRPERPWGVLSGCRASRHCETRTSPGRRHSGGSGAGGTDECHNGCRLPLGSAPEADAGGEAAATDAGVLVLQGGRKGGYEGSAGMGRGMKWLAEDQPEEEGE